MEFRYNPTIKKIIPTQKDHSLINIEEEELEDTKGR
jgi:hypothetical protein